MQKSTPDPSALFQPGERLGWLFRDRNQFRKRFKEQAPVLAPPPIHLQYQLQRSRAKLAGRLVLAVLAGGLGIVLFTAALNAEPDLAGLAATVMLAGFASAIALVISHVRLKHQVASAETGRRGSWAAAKSAWQARKAAFKRNEQERLDRFLEWGGVVPPAGTRRIDIVGGTMLGWEALLTVYGASLISTRGALTLIDLSGQAVGRELTSLVSEQGHEVDPLVLPDELAESDLLVGLDGRDLVDALVEAVHPGDQAASRADRAMDDRLLTAVCAALGPPISFSRIGEALRALMGEPAGPGSPVLTIEERRHIADELFSEQYRHHTHAHLSRLESFVHPLAELGERQQPRPAAMLTCLAMVAGGRNVRHELIHELIVQWLTRRLARQSTRSGSLVIAGADDIPARHLERLRDLCEQHDVRLVLLFRHLRGPALQAIGGGAVGFMRLGNHEQARQAADFIGRTHRFVLSQLTRTIGESLTRTDSQTEGTGSAEGRSSGSSRGRFWTVNSGRTWSTSRNWSHTRSLAEGDSWSEANGLQRVYEYGVEPSTLQELPDYALLLVERGPDGESVVAVECNPELVGMPRLSMDPLRKLPASPAPADPAWGQETVAPDWSDVPPRMR